MKRIAVFGAHRNVVCSYKQAKALGYYVIAIASPINDECRRYADRCYDVSFSDVERVYEICKNEKIDGITSFTLESALPYVTEVATRLGLVCNTRECIECIRTKYSQRQALKAARIPTPGFCKVYEDDIVNAQEVHYPCIVKPIDGGGSQSIVKLDDDRGLEHAIAAAQSSSRTHGAIIEDYIDGREFSVEYLSCRGVHYFCQLTDKVTSGEPLFVEIAHHQPADVSNELLQRIKDMVEGALTALKIENSASHTEIKLNSKGELYIIEIGARMGGDKITERLVQLSTGINFVECTLRLACREFVPPQVLYCKYAGVYFYSRLAPHIGDVIKNKDRYSMIVESEYLCDEEDLPEVNSNADRGGYFLYQDDKQRLEI